MSKEKRILSAAINILAAPKNELQKEEMLLRLEERAQKIAPGKTSWALEFLDEQMTARRNLLMSMGGAL